MVLNKITPEFLFNEDFKRIELNEELNMVNKPYSIKYLNKMLLFFEGTQEFMKCAIIKEYISEHFTHGKYWTLKKVID